MIAGTDLYSVGPVKTLQCKVGKPPEAYRYNISLNVLGIVEQWPYNTYGEASVSREMMTADHEGVSYMISHMPVIESVSPSSSGLLGGDVLTITGEGFGTRTENVEVDVGGSPCQIVSMTLKQIVCKLQPLLSIPAPVHFDGDADYVAWPAALYGDGDGISIMLWAKPNLTDVIGCWQRLVDVSQETGNGLRPLNNFYISRYECKNDLFFKVENNRDDKSGHSAQIANAYKAGVWSHIAWTMSRGNWMIYIDGTLVLKLTNMPDSAMPVSAIRNHVNWGKSAFGGSDANFAGLMMPGIITNTFLSAREISASYSEWSASLRLGEYLSGNGGTFPGGRGISRRLFYNGFHGDFDMVSEKVRNGLEPYAKPTVNETEFAFFDAPRNIVPKEKLS